MTTTKPKNKWHGLADPQRPDFHPAAGILPLKEPTIQKLIASISEYGLLYSIIRVNGLIFDGRKRQIACERAGEQPRYVDVELPEDATPEEISFAANCVRERHSREEMQAAQRLVLKAAPEKSNREIAREVGVDDKTVASARKQMEETAEIPQFSSAGGRGKTTGKKVEPSAPRDGLGNLIPAELQPVFAETWYAEAIKDLDALLRRTEIVASRIEQEATATEGNPFLNTLDLQNHLSFAIHRLRLAKQAVQKAKPYALSEQPPGWGPFVST